MDLLTVAETAKLLKLRQMRVYGMIRDGLLPAGVVVRFGRQIRIARPALEEFLQSGGQAYPGGWRKEASSRTTPPAPSGRLRSNGREARA